MICPACSKSVLGTCALCAACRAAYHAPCWKGSCAACSCAKEPVAASIGRPSRPNGWVLAIKASALAVLFAVVAVPVGRTVLEVGSHVRADHADAMRPGPSRGAAVVPPSEAARTAPPAGTRRAFQLFEDPQPTYAEVAPELARLRARPATGSGKVRVERVIVDQRRDTISLYEAPGTMVRADQVDLLIEEPGLRAREYELAVNSVVFRRPGALGFVQVQATAEPSRDGLAPAGGWTTVAVRPLANEYVTVFRFALPIRARCLRFVTTGDVDLEMWELRPPGADGGAPERLLVARAFDPLLGVGVDLRSDGEMVLFAGRERAAANDGTCVRGGFVPLSQQVPSARDPDRPAFAAELRAALGGPLWARAFRGDAVPAAEAPWRAGFSADAGLARLTEFLRSFALPRMRIALSRR